MYEEAFEEKESSYKFLFPITIEFSTMMFCIFYEMFCENGTVEAGTNKKIPSRQKNLPLIGSFFGTILCIFLVALSFSSQQDMVKFHTFWISNLFLLIIILVFLLISFVKKFKSGMQEVQREEEHQSHEVDKTIVDITIFGMLLGILSSRIVFIFLKGYYLLRSIYIFQLACGILLSLSQAYLILKVLDKKIGPEEMLFRNLAAIIAFLNLGNWIYEYVVPPTSIVPLLEMSMYGTFGWTVIWTVTHALGLFFHFHSFVIFLEAAMTTKNICDENTIDGAGVSANNRGCSKNNNRDEDES